MAADHLLGLVPLDLFGPGIPACHITGRIEREDGIFPQ